jgi:uncharacterized protein (TIGR03083 family)
VATDALEALRGECELVSQTVLGLSEEEFAKPTRCTEWNVKELLAHIYRAINRLNTGLDQPPPPAADYDSVTYWRSYDPATESGDIADRSKELAASFDSGQALASAWDELWRRALGRVGAADRSRVILTYGPGVVLGEYLRTRVLELTVHRMDLNDALGLPPDPTEAGLEITNEILLGLTGSPSTDVPLKGLDLLETGTGRRPLTDDERKALGDDLADRFPLLG